MNDISSKADEPTHLDLFSGIGGFALAAGWAGFKTIGFCDNEPYAQAVLKKHWPDVPIHGDIKTLDGTAYRGVTLLTGGFPCQPFSNAGKRRGKDDDRYLWPQMLRVIQEARPDWIVGENVVGIIGLALDQVLSDLEKEGYEVEAIIVPACGVDANHRRNRVWIVGGGGCGQLQEHQAEGQTTRRNACDHRDIGEQQISWVLFWPTPKANKVHPMITEQNRKKLSSRNKANLEEVIAGNCGKATGQLNPAWVEWLMGYPMGWTELKDSEMPLSRKSHTKSSRQ